MPSRSSHFDNSKTKTNRHAGYDQVSIRISSFGERSPNCDNFDRLVVDFDVFHDCLDGEVGDVLGVVVDERYLSIRVGLGGDLVDLQGLDGGDTQDLEVGERADGLGVDILETGAGQPVVLDLLGAVGILTDEA